MEEVRVAPDVLECGSRICADLREQLRAGVKDVEPETEAAVVGLAGWQTGVALGQVLWSWRDDLSRFGDYLDQFSDALTGCARDYRYSDHASAELFAIPDR